MDRCFCGRFCVADTLFSRRDLKPIRATDLPTEEGMSVERVQIGEVRYGFFDMVGRRLKCPECTQEQIDRRTILFQRVCQALVVGLGLNESRHYRTGGKRKERWTPWNS